MPAVLGSKQDELVIVADRPKRKFLWRAITLLLIIAAGVGGYLSGVYRSLELEQASNLKELKVRGDFEQQGRHIQQLRERVAELERGSEVDRQANEQNRKALMALRDENVQLEEQIAFYKRVLDPAGQKGLHLEKFEIEPALAAQRFRFNLVLAQLGSHKNSIKGSVQANVIGKQDGQPVVVPLKDLSDDIKSTHIPLGFRYFQNIRGEMTLPEGFSPEQIQVLVKTKGKRPQSIDTKIDWSLKEVQGNANVEQ